MAKQSKEGHAHTLSLPLERTDLTQPQPHPENRVDGESMHENRNKQIITMITCAYVLHIRMSCHHNTSSPATFKSQPNRDWISLFTRGLVGLSHEERKATAWLAGMATPAPALLPSRRACVLHMFLERRGRGTGHLSRGVMGMLRHVETRHVLVGLDSFSFVVVFSLLLLHLQIR